MMLFPHTVTLLPAVDVIDSYGTVTRVPAEDGPTSPAFVQPSGSIEDTAGPVSDERFCLLPSGVDVDAWAYLRHNGVLFEIDGIPGSFDSPDGPHHVEARLRRVR